MNARLNKTFTKIPTGSSAYRMPAEWEPHQATWLAWPHHRPDWPGKFEPIPWVYAEIIRHLAYHERVELIVNDAASEKRARTVLTSSNALNDNVRFHHWPTDRVWTRDSGCTFVKNIHHADSRLAAIHWRFNAWAKYSNWHRDEKIGSLMAKAVHAKEFRPLVGKSRIVLEGGSIDVNGRGALMTTEECLLSETQQRNPGMGREDYEKLFAEHLGIKRVIWLGKGITGDDTHGHIDDLARFVSPNTVVTVNETNPKDPNYKPLRDNLRRLRVAKTERGRPLNIVELPMPRPVFFQGTRVPASYANFYIANGIVLVPTFNDPKDRIVLNTLTGLFPDREVVGIYCGDLVWGFGTLHCMTQQQPR